LELALAPSPPPLPTHENIPSKFDRIASQLWV
jgi:hypothetical protein